MKHNRDNTSRILLMLIIFHDYKNIGANFQCRNVGELRVLFRTVFEETFIGVNDTISCHSLPYLRLCVQTYSGHKIQDLQTHTNDAKQKCAGSLMRVEVHRSLRLLSYFSLSFVHRRRGGRLSAHTQLFLSAFP